MVTMKERIKTWSRNRLEGEGKALFDLSVRRDGQFYRDTVLHFYISHGNGVLPTHHQFSQGDVIAISRRGPLEEADSVIEGVVMERARRFLKVAVPTRQAGDIDQSLKWRLDLSTNHVAYERCMWAINTFASPQIRQGFTRSSFTTPPKSQFNPLRSGSADKSLCTMGEGVMSFRDLIIQGESTQVGRTEPEDGKMLFVASKRNDFKQENQHLPKPHVMTESISMMNNPPSLVSGKHLGAYKSLTAALLRDMEMDINSSQRAAIQKAMCRRITLWQGPPGTGKTRTLVHFIKVFLKQGQGQVLACADSNVAVDNLVEGLLEQGLRVVRVGQPVKVKEELRICTVAAQVSMHPLMKRAQQYREEAILKRKVLREINNEKKRKAGAIDASGLWDKALGLEEAALKAVLAGVDVVAATCVGAADPVLDSHQFRACVIDEATQATEPATLIPILRSGADLIVLVGDPAQLPPTVISEVALEEGLSKSLFEHLQECGVEPLLLDTQYRMHPFLAAWPSAVFYGNQLLSHVKPSDRPIPTGLQWPNKAKPIAFFDSMSGAEETTALGNSWFNHAEALKVVNIVRLLIKDQIMDIRCDEIGVISPYSAQVRLLKDLFMKGESGEKGRFAELEVKTVDGFQGREKEVIVISTVRSNPEGKLGFLVDPRRMNVSLTRAKRALVVIGNSKTLQANRYWSQWLDMIKRERVQLQHIIEL